MALLAAGTKVRSTIDGRLTGTVVGHGFLDKTPDLCEKDPWTMQQVYLVRHDEGTWAVAPAEDGMSGDGVWQNVTAWDPDSLEVVL